jgi:hypothetical protein
MKVRDLASRLLSYKMPDCFSREDLLTMYEVLEQYRVTEKVDCLIEDSKTGLWTDGRDNDTKVALIEKTAEKEGFCYVRFLLAIPEALDMSAHQINRAINYLAELGPVRYGNDVIDRITEIKMMSRGIPIKKARAHKGKEWIKNVEELMESKARFPFSEINGIVHVGKPNYNWCSCTDIYCDHGWQFKYFMAILVQREMCVGGGTELDFNDFMVDDFDEISEDMQSTVHPLAPKKSAMKKVSNYLNMQSDPSSKLQDTGPSTRGPHGSTVQAAV